MVRLNANEQERSTLLNFANMYAEATPYHQANYRKNWQESTAQLGLNVDEFMKKNTHIPEGKVDTILFQALDAEAQAIKEDRPSPADVIYDPDRTIVLGSDAIRVDLFTKELLDSASMKYATMEPWEKQSIKNPAAFISHTVVSATGIEPHEVDNIYFDINYEAQHLTFDDISVKLIDMFEEDKPKNLYKLECDQAFEKTVGRILKERNLDDKEYYSIKNDVQEMVGPESTYNDVVALSYKPPYNFADELVDYQNGLMDYQNSVAYSFKDYQKSVKHEMRVSTDQPKSPAVEKRGFDLEF